MIMVRFSLEQSTLGEGRVCSQILSRGSLSSVDVTLHSWRHHAVIMIGNTQCHNLHIMISQHCLVNVMIFWYFQWHYDGPFCDSNVAFSQEVISFQIQITYVKCLLIQTTVRSRAPIDGSQERGVGKWGMEEGLLVLSVIKPDNLIMGKICNENS